MALNCLLIRYPRCEMPKVKSEEYEIDKEYVVKGLGLTGSVLRSFSHSWPIKYESDIDLYCLQSQTKIGDGDITYTARFYASSTTERTHPNASTVFDVYDILSTASTYAHTT